MKLAVFTSDRFKPFLPDHAQVNPNVLGFELAEWLARELSVRNVITSYPSFEDWGWYLEYEGGYLICCSGGENGGTYEWRVFVDRPRRLFRKPPADMTQDQLFDSIVALLRDHGIAVEIESDL
jgi:hypothetical protein